MSFPRGNAAPNSPQKINAAVRRGQIVKLRIAGASMEQIRQQLGMSRAGVYKALHTALDEQRETTAVDLDEMRQLHSLRIDSMLMALWPQIEKGNSTAIEKGVQLLARQARLYGLDAPARMEMAGKDGGPIGVEVARTRIAEKLARFSGPAGPGEVPGEPDRD